MVFSTGVLILVAFVTVLAYLYSQRRPKNFPPGPRWAFPILGHIPLLGKEPYKTGIYWKEKYGPITGFQFGSFRAVMINDSKLIKEATNDPAFSGRPKIPMFADRSNGKAEGLIFTEGRQWQEQRRFALRNLRDFGFGKNSIETIVHDEIKELIERFKEDVGIPIDTRNRCSAAGLNALWTIVAGDRFKQDDPKVNEIMRLFSTNIAEFSLSPLAMLGMFVPWTARWIPKLIQYDKLLAPVKPTCEFLQPHIDQHFETHEPGLPRDFIDTYIDEMKRTEDPTSSFHKCHPLSLLFTVFDLFQAGGETTSMTISWIFLYMSRHPHVQDKLAAEIQNVIGNSRLPSLNDRAQMPYTDAVINEVLRVRTLVPLTLLSTMEDVKLSGYDIPKDTLVVTNLYASNNSIELWGDPENFRPERFLSEDESEFVRHEGFMTFSSGKRVCLGETLARSELYLFTSALFQVFQVEMDPNSPPPTLEPSTTAGVLLPKAHKLVLRLRDL